MIFVARLEVFMKKVLVCPSILSANFACLMSEVERLEKAGVDILHVDVMDGHFVPNISFGAPVLRSLSASCDMFMDVHLMATNPCRHIKALVDAGASSITFHVECDDNITDCIDMLREFGCRCGISIKPKTSVDAILPYLDLVDMVLVMTVEPGFAGQAFMPDMLDKIRQIRSLNPKIDLQADGGINPKNAKSVWDAGANLLVAGSAIFGEKDFKKAVKNLRFPGNHPA